MRLLSVLVIMFTLLGCAIRPANFQNTSVPDTPDYNNTGHWASLPGMDDMADLSPDPKFPDLQATAIADVFFIHPTIFTKRSNAWNASLADERLNRETDESTIKFQASIFNGAGRIYAPRYRQAHLRSFFSEDKKSSKEAIDLAYADVKLAFEYYLTHFNQGRPIIIAAHSQGAVHGLRLLKEFFDNTALRERLVAAYLIGWPVPANSFVNIPVCKDEVQTGCVCSWRTWLWGHSPKIQYAKGEIIVTNPLTWKTSEELAPKNLHKGAVLRKFDSVYPGIADAKIEANVLWTHKPKFPGSFLIRRKNYHIADLNLFYIDIRENVIKRAAAMQKN